MVIAFQGFDEILKLDNSVDQHKAWLKSYKGIQYSIAEFGNHKIKWQTQKVLYEKYSTEINCIGRLPNRTVIEFDGEPNKAKEDLEITKKKLESLNIGFIRSTHKGKSDYLWIEFNRDMKDKEVENFLAWIAPKGSEIDLNFASSKKVFPILFALHWKYTTIREKPIEYFPGQQIDYDSLQIPLMKNRQVKTINREDFNYKTFIASKVFGKASRGEIFNCLQPIFYDKSGTFWLWNYNKKCWEIIDEIDLLNVIEEGTGVDIISSQNRTEIINTLKQEGRKNMPKPIKPTWIQFKDTIVDISTGEKFESTPEYFSTNPIPWGLHKDNFESTPIMDSIFEQWVGPENIRKLYEIISYCLLPSYPIHRLFCFIGAGMNGKSCFINLLRKFIGEKNSTSTELDTLLNSRFEVTKLYRKLLCVMGETNFKELQKTSIIKKLTGGDLIGFEYKNKTPFDELNYAKIVIATNNLPETDDKTIGFYRRWLIIDFPNQFTEQKDILATIPEEEYEALALKSSIILHDLLKAKKFTNEGSIEERMRKYEEKSNPFDKFLSECCDCEDPNGYIWKFDFEKKFREWCKENHFRDYSEIAIGRKMKEKGINPIQKYSDWFIDGQKKLLRTWIGIKWKENLIVLENKSKL